MRKLIMMVSLFVVVSGYASTNNQQQFAEQADRSAVTIAQMDDLDDSFLKVAAIGRNIEMANREIEAAQLQAQLDALHRTQNMRSLGFAVYQILGFGKTLTVTLVTTSGSFLELGPGEMINVQYRVNLITPSTVKVMDVGTGKIYNVPFNKPVITNSKGKVVSVARIVADNQLISDESSGGATGMNGGLTAVAGTAGSTT